MDVLIEACQRIENIEQLEETLKGLEFRKDMYIERHQILYKALMSSNELFTIVDSYVTLYSTNSPNFNTYNNLAKEMNGLYTGICNLENLIYYANNMIQNIKNGY